MVLNTSKYDANLRLSFYFEDREPIENIIVVVEAKRVKCIKMDNFLEGVDICFGGVGINGYIAFNEPMDEN